MRPYPYPSLLSTNQIIYFEATYLLWPQNAAKMFQSFSSILDQTILYKEQMNKWGSGFSIEDDKRSNIRG